MKIRIALLLLSSLVYGCGEQRTDAVGALHGQVTLASSAAGDFAGIAITVAGPTVRELALDADGRFADATLPVGEYTLTVTAENSREQARHLEVVVIATQDTLAPPTVLHAIAYAKGRVLIDGASSHAGTTLTASDGSSAETGADGTFTIAVDAAATSVVAQHAGEQPQSLPLSGIGRGVTLELGTIRLVAGAVAMYPFAGDVRIAGTSDASGVTVQLTSARTSLTTITDDKGHFVFAAVPVGTYAASFVKGDQHEHIDQLLLGLGTARVIESDGLEDLGVVELAARERLELDRWERRPIAVSPDGHWVVDEHWDPYDAFTVWDATTNTSVLELPARTYTYSSKAPVIFDGAAVIQATDVGADKALQRTDLTTRMMTTLATGFTDAQHFAELRTTLLTTYGQGNTITLARFVPWDGGAAVPIDSTDFALGTTTFVQRITNDKGAHLEWRSSHDGALVQTGDSDATSSAASTMFLPHSGRILVTASDHLEIWNGSTIVKSAPLTCYTKALSRDEQTLFCGAQGSAILSAWSSVDLSPLGATDTVHGTPWFDPAGKFVIDSSLHRLWLDGTVEDLGKHDANLGVTTADGVWILGNEALFVPSAGPIVTRVSALILDATIQPDGALTYRSTDVGDVDTLHRLTSAGVDQVVDQHVTKFQFVSSDVALTTRHVGDRDEQFLVRVGGASVAVGADVSGALPVDAHTVYVSREHYDHYYSDGLYRTKLP